MAPLPCGATRDGGGKDVRSLVKLQHVVERVKGAALAGTEHGHLALANAADLHVETRWRGGAAAEAREQTTMGVGCHFICLSHAAGS